MIIYLLAFPSDSLNRMYLTYAGRILQDEHTLAYYLITEHGTLYLNLRLRTEQKTEA